MTTRRHFLLAAGAALAGAAAPGRLTAMRRSSALASPSRGARGDLLIRGGTVFDGTGAAGVEADVLVRAGRIAGVGRGLQAAGAEEVDARGLAVAPGFIDIHSHADGSLFGDPAMESIIRQGITTVVAGQDGALVSSPARNGSPRTPSVGAFMAAFTSTPGAANVACMVGLGGVRGEVVGQRDVRATPAQLRLMTAMVERALSDGACGASSGLEYTPGAFASLEELIALCRPLAARGLPYATHMRNEDDRLLEAIAESIAVAEGAGCPLQLSHLKTQGPRNWPRLDDAFAAVEGARSRGVDAAFDRYPYLAYQTGLTNLFPVWSRDGGWEAFLRRLGDDSVAPGIREAVLGKVELIGGWDNVQVTSVRTSGDRRAEGARLGEYALAQGVDPYEAVLGLLRRNSANVGIVGFAMSEENLERILAHPLGMVCSDGGAYAISGPARSGQPHPRALGAFPRVLARYVRERGTLTLEQAVHKMSGLPASRLRITDRGRIAPGLAADIVVFDPSAVEDRATFSDPYRYPVGMELVLVNGAVALREGQRTPARAGTVVRPSAWAAAG